MNRLVAGVAVAVFGWGGSVIWAMAIVLTPDAGLSANPAALAAFNRAAVAWSSKFTNNITVNISAGLSNSFVIPGIIGSTSSVRLPAPYDFFLGKIKASAATEPDDGIVAFLPSQSQFSATLPTGITFSGNFIATKANFKALGYMDLINLDVQYGSNDSTITFNSNVPFDYDNSNGVTPGTIDFQTVAAHEIGHALGFISSADTVDGLKAAGTSGSISITPLDLFRFQNNVALKDPSTTMEFTNFPRYLDTDKNSVLSGSAIFDELTTELALSTGRNTGDGLEASHWKDDAITSNLLGVMDPSLNYGVTETISANDIRALDLIGYHYVVPEPAMLALVVWAVPLMRRPSRRS